MFTKEQLISFGVEKLADIVVSLQQNRPDIQKQLKIILAGFDSDPKRIIAMVKKEIGFLKRSTHFIDINESSSFADQINQARIHIMEDILPKSPNQAIDLMLNLLDIHQETLERTDDSNGTVGNVFAQICADLGKAYEYIASSLDDIVNLVYNHFMDNGYCVLDNIIFDFKDVLGNIGLNQLKQRLAKSFNKENEATIKSGLKNIADCQNDIDVYIQACSVTGKPYAHEYLEIAKRLITHQRCVEAIEWLDCMEDFPITHVWHSEKRALKIQALDSCGSYKEAQAERLNWFETTLSPKVYWEILMHAEADSIELFKNTAIQKAFDFPDSDDALVFLKEINEFEQAAKLVCQKIDTFNGNNDNTLRSIADILCPNHPLAATLLYRKLVERPLVGPRCRSYSHAAQDLTVCHSLSSKITDWQGHKSHQLYFKELSFQHKRKRSFWGEYTSALNKKRAKDSK